MDDATTLVGFGVFGPLWVALSVWSIIAAREATASRRWRARAPGVVTLASTGVCGILAALTVAI